MHLWKWPYLAFPAVQSVQEHHRARIALSSAYLKLLLLPFWLNPHSFTDTSFLALDEGDFVFGTSSVLEVTFIVVFTVNFPIICVSGRRSCFYQA